MDWPDSVSPQALENLLRKCDFSSVVLVGAGPSLDYCTHEIEEALEKGALFFLTDIVARQFVHRYPSSHRVIFSVENRRHDYLQSLYDEDLAFYAEAGRYNLPRCSNRVYLFHFDFDQKNLPQLADVSTCLVSPGTVAGAALSAALYLARLNAKMREIRLLGLDFSYPEERVYARMAASDRFPGNYWRRREVHEWEAAAMRGSRFQVVGGYVIRTSEEFYRSKENFEILLGSIEGSSIEGITIIDYSPLGLSRHVIKKIPASMK